MIVADYTIAGVNVPLYFNNRTFRLYSEKRGVELEDLKDEIRGNKGFHAGTFHSLLLIAHQTYCLYVGTPCTATELDADEWVDLLGGTLSTAAVDLLLVYTAKLFGLPLDKLKAEVEKAEGDEEKKSTPRQKKGQRGESTTSTGLQRA